jgi:hypothetical protein
VPAPENITVEKDAGTIWTAEVQAAPRARSSRWVVVACLAVVGLLLAGAGTLIWTLRQGATLPDREWQTFQSNEGHFRILFPEPPDVQRTTLSTPTGPIESVRFHKKYRHPQVGFGIDYFDVTPRAFNELPLEKRFEGAREGARAGINGKVVSEKEIKLGNYPGREWHLRGDRTSSVTSMIAIPDGENMRIFILSVDGVGITPSSPEVSRFLHSFAFELLDPVEAHELPAGFWKPFSSGEGRFQIIFPKDPSLQESEIDFKVGKVKRFAYTRSYTTPEVSFWADYMDLTPEVARQCPPEECFDYLQGRMLRPLRDGKVVRANPWKLGAHPGREILLAGGGTEVAARMAAVPVGQNTRLFLLMVRGVNIRSNTKDVARFFDSFSYREP